MSNTDYTQCFPGMAYSGESCFRFLDKDTTNNEQFMFDNWWREIINLYGQKITYYANGYSVISADNFYGEDITRPFAPGVEMVAAINLNENADTLSRFGFQSDDEVTLTIHSDSFILNMLSLSSTVYQDQFNQIEPKSGDVFTLTEYGRGRFGNRGPKQFEVTDRADEDASSINQLGGHYVWVLKAKRLEYSFEPGLSAEFRGSQVFDNSYSGVLSGVGNNTLSAKKYDFDIDQVSRTVVFDMSANNPTDIYGSY